MTAPRSTTPTGPRPGLLRVNRERLLDTQERFAAFGATAGGGLNRLTLDDHDRRARDELRDLAQERGYRVDVDAVGNIFVTRPGTDESLPVVLIGSHLDSQPFGGRFDGTYGVLAGLEVLRSLDDAGVRTRRGITLVDWTNEEGSRFSPSLLGSSVFSGTLPLDEALERTDSAGIRLGDELERIGYAGTYEASRLRIHRAFEAHIEQGPLLEEAGTDIGVVTGIQGIRQYDVAIQGEPRHAGTTPHDRRKDALVAAARLIAAVEELAERLGPDLRATVGELRIAPNSRNVVPGHALLLLDVRHPDDDVLDRAEEGLRDAVARLSARTGLPAEMRTVLRVAPTRFDADSVSLVRVAAEALGLSHAPLASGAGHDSMRLAPLAPTAMVFIPCVDGISHAEAEDIRDEWAVNGADVLLTAVARAAEEEEERA
ncbi:MAG TPA: Zn-dependent hydrolase [Arachnia sp.]|nr:Zn-dependent hydrolase [Arachnia sp.]HMT87692.1 Zn-dependent hydrolase [Arachnia sp.]